METTNTNNESLKGVRILRSYYEALDEFTYEEKGRMFEAIMEYGLNGTEPNFDGAEDARALRGIWKTYLPIIDNSINRAIASAKNGNKGGAPVKKSNDVVESSKTSTQNKALESTIPTQSIPEDQVEEKVALIEEKAPIKASDIPRQSIQVKVLDVAAPVIENKVDCIDYKNFSIIDLRKIDSKYEFSNCKVKGGDFNTVIGKLTSGQIQFNEMIAECDELVNNQNKAIESTITTEVIIEDQEEEIVANIEENEVIFMTPELFHIQTNNKYKESPAITIQMFCNMINDGRETIETIKIKNK